MFSNLIAEVIHLRQNNAILVGLLCSTLFALTTVVLAFLAQVSK